jgi:hypothetical protein
MKLIDGGKHAAFWRDVRKRVAAGQIETYKGVRIPNGFNALLLDLQVE